MPERLRKSNIAGVDHTGEKLVLPEGKTGDDLFLESDWKELGSVLFPGLSRQKNIPQQIYSDTAEILAQAAVFMGDGKREEDLSNLVTTHKTTDRPLSHKRAFAVAKVKSAMILMDSLRRNEGKISLIDYATAKTYHLIEKLTLMGKIPPWEKDREQRIFLPFAGFAVHEMNSLVTKINITNPEMVLRRLRASREAFVNFNPIPTETRGFKMEHIPVQIVAVDNNQTAADAHNKHSARLIPTVKSHYFVQSVQDFSLGHGEKPFDLCMMLKTDPAFFPDPLARVIYTHGGLSKDEITQISGDPIKLKVMQLLDQLKRSLKPKAPLLITFERTNDINQSLRIQHAVDRLIKKGRKWNISEVPEITAEEEERNAQPHDHMIALVGRAPNK